VCPNRVGKASPADFPQIAPFFVVFLQEISPLLPQSRTGRAFLIVSLPSVDVLLLLFRFLLPPGRGGGDRFRVVTPNRFQERLLRTPETVRLVVRVITTLVSLLVGFRHFRVVVRRRSRDVIHYVCYFVTLRSVAAFDAFARAYYGRQNTRYSASSLPSTSYRSSVAALTAYDIVIK